MNRFQIVNRAFSEQSRSDIKWDRSNIEGGLHILLRIFNVLFIVAPATNAVRAGSSLIVRFLPLRFQGSRWTLHFPEGWSGFG